MRTKKLVTNNWATPDWLFGYYDGIHHFSLDAAASSDNAKCEKYITEEENALTCDWLEKAGGKWKSVWVNPPYTQLKQWVLKAHDESCKGLTVVLLLPAGTDTEWFEYCYEKATEIDFLRGRVKFVGAPGSAMSPSIVVTFRGINLDPPAVVDCLDIRPNTN